MFVQGGGSGSDDVDDDSQMLNDTFIDDGTQLSVSGSAPDDMAAVYRQALSPPMRVRMRGCVVRNFRRQAAALLGATAGGDLTACVFARCWLVQAQSEHVSGAANDHGPGRAVHRAVGQQRAGRL